MRKGENKLWTKVKENTSTRLTVNPVLSGGSNGGARDACSPPGGPNSFNFMQFLGKFGKIVCWRPPGELAPPPRGNPGSATGSATLGNKCTHLPWPTLHNLLLRPRCQPAKCYVRLESCYSCNQSFCPQANSIHD